MVLITHWQPEWRFLSQCDHKSQSQNCYYTIHDHLFNTKQFWRIWTTLRVLTCQRTMHRKHLNEKSFGPFRPVRPAGLEVQARPCPRAARPVTITTWDILQLTSGTTSILLTRRNQRNIVSNDAWQYPVNFSQQYFCKQFISNIFRKIISLQIIFFDGY